MNHKLLLVAASAFTILVSAQNPDRAPRPPQDSATPAVAEARVALVIGNGAYKDAPLKNPVNDARAMSEALEQCGFKVIKLEDGNREQMAHALREFGERIQGGGVGLFYFAGHGMQVKGKNYLVPVGADIATEDEVPYHALDADAVLAKMETARNRLNILILDACRNNPFGRSFRSAQQGLAQMDAPAGSYIAFATSPGRTAADGTRTNGLYTQHLLATLKTPGLKVEEVFKRVRNGVMGDSQDQQIPWESSSLRGDFYFVPGADPSTVSTVASAASTVAVPSVAGASPSWRTELGGVQMALIGLLNEDIAKTLPKSDIPKIWKEAQEKLAEAKAKTSDPDLGLLLDFVNERIARMSSPPGSIRKGTTLEQRWEDEFTQLKVLAILYGNTELDAEMLKTMDADYCLGIWNQLQQRLNKAPDTPEARGREFDILRARIMDKKHYWTNRVAESL